MSINKKFKAATVTKESSAGTYITFSIESDIGIINLTDTIINRGGYEVSKSIDMLLDKDQLKAFSTFILEMVPSRS